VTSTYFFTASVGSPSVDGSSSLLSPTASAETAGVYSASAGATGAVSASAGASSEATVSSF
tara:strand:+ start:301 stop:483 length:183 start_codon:yes stop_codon:yes gene_type:complete